MYKASTIITTTTTKYGIGYYYTNYTLDAL